MVRLLLGCLFSPDNFRKTTGSLFYYGPDRTTKIYSHDYRERNLERSKMKRIRPGLKDEGIFLNISQYNAALRIHFFDELVIRPWSQLPSICEYLGAMA